MSPFQSLKITFVENLHLAKDGIHIYLGVSCFLIAVAIVKDIINTNLIPLILLFAVRLDLFERRRTMQP